MHRVNGTVAVMAGGAVTGFDAQCFLALTRLTTKCMLSLGCSVILGIYSGTWGTAQLGEDLQVKVASSVAAAYLLLFLKAVMNSSETSLTKVSD